VRFRLARGQDTPLAQGPVSIESQAPPRASSRLARGHHGPAVSIPAPPAGAFNTLTSAGARVKGESTPLRAWESCPGTALPTPWQGHPRHCATPCGMVSNNLVVLCHPLPYGWRAAPSRKDGGVLEGKVNSYAAPVREQRHDARSAGPVTSVAISRVRPSPPSPTPSRPLHRHPRRCRSVRQRDTATPATVPPYGLASTAPSSPHIGGRRTGNRYTATLEAAPGRIQDAP
jgi:hypothetical protein